MKSFRLMTVPAIEVNREAYLRSLPIGDYMDCCDLKKGFSNANKASAEYRLVGKQRVVWRRNLSRMILAGVEAVKFGHRARADFPF
ncbi:MAG TPA: hypothetical protein VF452_10370 [Candidatus Binatia bacterium]